MDATTIIRRPLITEKVTFQSNDQNRYTFEVDRRATKPQIKTAIERGHAEPQGPASPQPLRLLAQPRHEARDRQGPPRRPHRAVLA